MTKPVLTPGPDHPITISQQPGRVVISRNGRVLVDTQGALRLQEASYPAVLYVPRADADMAALQPTDHTTYCPYKGDASYFTIADDAEPAENAVWTYEQPYDAVVEIKEHLAFYADRVDIRVEA